MVQVKDRIELKLQDLWRKVKSEEAWWGNMKEETLRFVKRLLESALEEELLEVTACWSLLYSSRSILRHHFQPLFAVIARSVNDEAILAAFHCHCEER